ncbi:uncharacterized protein Dvar_20470 [Desulfosarcina variabilis str. Montpellier]|uniref:hypothetical protein n=1 Tax=Desulfosarcina variabilis TaxID=2300 RepID=UPI003AFB070F
MNALFQRMMSIDRRWALVGLAALVLTACATVRVRLHEQKVDGHYLYFPQDENEIAGRLADEIGDMLQFLARHGLTVTAPVHIILDPELDAPDPMVFMIPHREIRLPIKAPGVFEDGWLEPDPWRYYLFKGLCLQALYAMRSGLPALLHKGFGEIVSPNIVLPDWITDGICHWLYTRFNPASPPDPLNLALFQLTPLPGLDELSNHPEGWPGYYSYRVFGRRFIHWVVQRYGWRRVHDFLAEHGRGIIPIEIDLKAERRLGSTWAGLWRMFQQDVAGPKGTDGGIHLVGYWPDPFVYWNRKGVYPGVDQTGHRSRYGWLEAGRTLWLSQYDEQGVSKRVRTIGDQPVWTADEHVWDPGPGGVAVTRDGHRPGLVIFAGNGDSLASSDWLWLSTKTRLFHIPGPDGVIQLSGPVRDSHGRIAVAGNTGGNWDIWLYDNGWQRLTQDTATDIDPWFEGQTILYATDRSGVFRIVDTAGNVRSACETVAVMPRDNSCLCLSGNGWTPTALLPVKENAAPAGTVSAGATSDEQGTRSAPAASPDMPEPEKSGRGPGHAEPARRYRPWRSVPPNYLMPELFISDTDFQLGVATTGYDASGDYRVDGGVRYSADNAFWSLRAGVSAMGAGLRYTRYPFSYEPAVGDDVDESRHEVKAYWRPWESDKIELSFNYRFFEDNLNDKQNHTKAWGAVHLSDTYGRHGVWLDTEWFADESLSVFGGGRLLFGESIYSMLHLQAGHTWGDLSPGHNTYRVGGDVVEGYFTQRPSRLFPLRGFDASILDAGQAVTSGFEVFWPLATLQAGYETLPLFLHRMMIGTFVDVGVAADPFTREDILVGGGFELVTTMEIAWGHFSSFRVGIAWPLRQPDSIDQEGPIFLIQLGRPL